MGEKAKARRVAELSGEWKVDFSGDSAGRSLVKEGVLLKTDRHGRKEPINVLLFNDLIV
jgi:hypothetical protein